MITAERESDLLLSGLLLCGATRALRYGHRLASNLPALEMRWALLVFALYTVAFAAVLGSFLVRWPQIRPILPVRWLRYVTLCAMLVLIGRQLLERASAPSNATDAVMFSRYGCELLRDGINPYTVDMASVYDRYGATLDWATFRIDGSIVTVLSYPALSFLLFLPQSLLGFTSFEVTTLLALGASLLWLTWYSPAWLSWLPLLMVAADWDVVAFSAGGIFDALWLLPLLGAMYAYAKGGIRWSGALFGVACCVKQTPWLAAPFLVLFVALDGPRWRWRETWRFVSSAIAGFALVNAPFILTAPVAWLRGSLTPVAGGPPLVELGSGPVLLNIIGATALPKAFYSVLALAFMALALVAYASAYRRVKWIAWASPMFVLWLNYRSLQNYFVFFVPVAYFGLILRREQQHVALDVTRRWLTLAAATSCLAVVIFTAVCSHQTELNAKAVITDVRDPNELGSATELAVKVTNMMSTPLTPAFSFVHAKHTVPMMWSVKDGPKSVAPNQSALYVLVPPVGTNGPIGFEESAHLRVFERGTERRTSTRYRSLEAFDKTPSRHHIRNPRFVAWAARPVTSYPSHWYDAGARSHRDFEPRLEKTQDGVRLAIRGSGSSEVHRNMALVALRQDLLSPVAGLRVTLSPHTLTKFSDGELPESASGLELRVKGRRIRVFFSDVATLRVVPLQTGDVAERLIYVPSSLDARHTYDIPLRTLLGEDYFAPFLQPHEATVVVFAGLRVHDEAHFQAVTIHELRALPL